MSRKIYRAPWGRRVWLLTGSLVVAGVVLALVFPFLLVKEGEPMILSLLPAIAMLLIFGGTALFVVRRYEVMDDRILVRRSFWTDSIELSGLKSIEADPRACSGAFKTIGNDGLFAMHGRFHSKKLGSFRAFVTNPQNGVIQTGGTLVMPDQRKTFLLRINPKLWAEIESWAQEDLRSVNGQIEFLLKQAVARRRRENPDEEHPS